MKRRFSPTTLVPNGWLFLTNGANGTAGVLDLSDPTNSTLLFSFMLIFTPDRTRALVALQKNNAVVAISITAKNALDILPLSLGDVHKEIW